MNDPRWASIDAFAEENRDNILRDITRLVAVPRSAPAPRPRWPRHLKLPSNWAFPPATPTATSAGLRPALSLTTRSSWPPSPTPM